MNPNNQTQVVIVGGGPIGIELAVALKHRSIDSQIFEAGPIGHTISWWAPQTKWFSSNERISIAGVPLMTVDGSKASREEYLTYLRGVVVQFELSIHTYQRVAAIARHPTGGFVVRANSETKCDQVVLAIGGTDFPRALGIPGEELPHVDGYLREPHRYCGRRVMIVGGRNSAVEAALRLHHAGAQVEISYRQSELPTESIKYWLTPEILGLIDAGRIVAHLGTVPVAITNDQIRLKRIAEETTYSVPVDDVLSLIGYEQEKSLFHAAGIELVESMQRPVYDPETMQTNVDGIYVAGTAVAGTQNSKYKTFLENCHQHVDKIVADIAGGHSPSRQRAYASQIAAQPET
jgi:thioredoxin reductase (NADPH)